MGAPSPGSSFEALLDSLVDQPIANASTGIDPPPQSFIDLLDKLAAHPLDPRTVAGHRQGAPAAGLPGWASFATGAATGSGPAPAARRLPQPQSAGTGTGTGTAAAPLGAPGVVKFDKATTTESQWLASILKNIKFDRLIAIPPQLWTKDAINELLPPECQLDPAANWSWLGRSLDLLVFEKLAELRPGCKTYHTPGVAAHIAGMVRSNHPPASKLDVQLSLNAIGAKSTPQIIAGAANLCRLSLSNTYGPGQPASAFAAGAPALALPGAPIRNAGSAPSVGSAGRPIVLGD